MRTQFLFQISSPRAAFLLFAAMIPACASLAQAQTPIGGAALVEKDVRGRTDGGFAPLSRGDQVFQDERVRTAAESQAKIVFRDDTNMSVGPLSEVSLDRYVFDPSGSARTVAVTAARGAFRFISGNSAHEAYKVQTPQATIGVRGTIYDVKVEPARSIIVLQSGAVRVCVRGTTRCTDLTLPGQSVTVTSRTISGPTNPATPPWQFAAGCVTTPDACKPLTFASLGVPTRVTRVTPKAPPKIKVVAKPRKPKRRVVRYEEPDDEAPVFVRPGPAVVDPTPVIGLGLGIIGGIGGGYRGGGGPVMRGGGINTGRGLR